jgi:hypothetical protein
MNQRQMHLEQMTMDQELLHDGTGKIMSKRSYPCTIIFVAVTGENKVFMADI